MAELVRLYLADAETSGRVGKDTFRLPALPGRVIEPYVGLVVRDVTPEIMDAPRVLFGRASVKVDGGFYFASTDTARDGIEEVRERFAMRAHLAGLSAASLVWGMRSPRWSMARRLPTFV